MNNIKKSKNIKYLSERERSRYYRLFDSNQRTDADVEELLDLEAKADRKHERVVAASNKRVWEE